MTDRVRAALAPVDDLLDQLDREHIEEALAAGEPDPWISPTDDDACQRCGHQWHGLPCAPPIRFWPNRGRIGQGDIRSDAGAKDTGLWGCPCESSTSEGPPLDVPLGSVPGMVSLREALISLAEAERLPVRRLVREMDESMRRASGRGWVSGRGVPRFVGPSQEVPLRTLGRVDENERRPS